MPESGFQTGDAVLRFCQISRLGRLEPSREAVCGFTPKHVVRKEWVLLARPSDTQILHTNTRRPFHIIQAAQAVQKSIDFHTAERCVKKSVGRVQVCFCFSNQSCVRIDRFFARPNVFNSKNPARACRNVSKRPTADHTRPCLRRVPHGRHTAVCGALSRFSRSYVLWVMCGEKRLTRALTSLLFRSGKRP